MDKKLMSFNFFCLPLSSSIFFCLSAALAAVWTW